MAITSAGHAKSLRLALLLSFISTIVCFLLAYPLAMILANMKVKRHNFIILIFILPMWMNFLLRTLAWQTLLEKNGVINHILSFLMVLPLYNALAKIDTNVINAARDLGASHFYTFIRIILPLSVPGIISGITMVFIPALTTFVISSLLGGGKLLLIGDVIEQEFTRTSNWHLGSGLSMVLMIFILINMVLSAIFDKEGEGSML